MVAKSDTISTFLLITAIRDYTDVYECDVVTQSVYTNILPAKRNSSVSQYGYKKVDFHRTHLVRDNPKQTTLPSKKFIIKITMMAFVKSYNHCQTSTFQIFIFHGNFVIAFVSTLFIFKRTVCILRILHVFAEQAWSGTASLSRVVCLLTSLFSCE